MSYTSTIDKSIAMSSLDRIVRRVERKLSFSGYELDAYFSVLGGGLASFKRGLDSAIVYIPIDKEEFDRHSNTIDTVTHVIGFNEVFYVDVNPLGEISLLKREPQPNPALIPRCKMFLRLLTSVSEGQWFDHIRHRAKLRARASVELIRAIRVLEEMQVVDVAWRKFGAGMQHTLIVRRRLSKGELAYYLSRLLNVALEKSLRRSRE